jgi:glutamate--cysteine ligase
MTATAALDFFARSVRERLFVPRPKEMQRVGAEIEMLPFFADSGLPCPLEATRNDERCTLALIRAHGARLEWEERRSSKGAPYFALPNGWTLTFEPGGQLELCTLPRASISCLLHEVRTTIIGLKQAAVDAGIELASVGIDPRNDIRCVPLQLHSPRYERMTRYFESIGPSGARMMRQTAATQVSLDPGRDPAWRWRLLSDLTPYLTAMFANSPSYAGERTDYQSFRARCWRLLDPSRTGVPHPQLSACEAYTRFALDAGDMSRTGADGTYRSFGEWASDGQWTEPQWNDHLTTLFPEVRPRGHLEVRSIDALEPEMLGAPLILLAGLIYDEQTAEEARRLLPSADEEILNRAAQCGLHDETIGRIAADLALLGIRGAQALGEDVVTGSDLESAEEFFRAWTLARRAPADAS